MTQFFLILQKYLTLKPLTTDGAIESSHDHWWLIHYLHARIPIVMTLRSVVTLHLRRRSKAFCDNYCKITLLQRIQPALEITWQIYLFFSMFMWQRAAIFLILILSVAILRTQFPSAGGLLELSSIFKSLLISFGDCLILFALILFLILIWTSLGYILGNGSNAGDNCSQKCCQCGKKVGTITEPSLEYRPFD